jgi:pimeloyl-ACP methyl ester carboxylesterase
MVNSSMKSVVLNGQRVAYSTIGVGVPVVFVHGSFASSSAWRRLVASLDASSCNAITLDLPGWGESDPSPADCVGLLEYEATAVAAVVDQLSVGPIHLVGHSHGGVVALAAALARRVELRSLTLFEPLPVSVLSEMGDADAYGDLTRFASDYRDAFDAGDPWAVRGVIDLWGGSGAFEAMSPAARDAIADGTAQNIRQWQGTFAFRPTLDALRALTVPTLLVQSERANPIAKLIIERLHELIEGSNVAEIAGANHFLIHTHSAECARIVSHACHSA